MNETPPFEPAAEAAAETHADGPPEAAPSEAPSVAPAPPPAAATTAEASPAATAKRLAECFPALFGAEPKPIKLRIQADLQQRAPGEFSRKALSLFLHRHTTSTPYLKALVSAATRFDLDGQPAGEIAEEHREAARVELARRKQVASERRAAEREKALQARRESEQQARREHNQQRRTEQKERRAARQQVRSEGLAQDIERERQRSESEAGDAQRRERAALLRAWETTTLTRANFLVLKRLSGDELDAQLALARSEAAQRHIRSRP